MMTTPVSGNTAEEVAHLRQLVLDTMGRTFRVIFVSRGKNETRDMRCRIVRIGRDQVELDKRNHQFTVFDVVKKSWRVVPLERVAVFRCGAVEWVTKVGS